MNLNIFFPKIRLHTWGGLGSQLYAVALAIQIKKRFPYRDIEFICHTSGVTKREPEIQFFSNIFKTKNDFEDLALNSLAPHQNNQKVFINLLTKSLLLVGLIGRCNSNHEVTKLRPWILMIRGHYTGLDISSHIALEILQIMEKSFKNNKSIETNDTSLHYRLGDLINLKEKNPINIKVLSEVILKIDKNNKLNKVYLYSDSIDIALTELRNIPIKLELIPRQISTLETVLECVKSSIFIGTNSKISIWIAILRAVSSSINKSYLPSDLKQIVNKNLGAIDLSNSIIYY